MKIVKLLLDCTVNGKFGKKSEKHELSDHEAKGLISSNIAILATDDEEEKKPQDQKSKK